MTRITVALALAIILVLAALAWLIRESPPPRGSADFASWAQAFGTVGAVLIAALVAIYQSDHASFVRRRDVEERRLTAFATFRVASERVVEAIRDTRARVIENRVEQAAAIGAIETITGSLHQLEAIPVADFASHRASLAAARFAGKARETTLSLRIIADNQIVPGAISGHAFNAELNDLTTWRALVVDTQ